MSTQQDIYVVGSENRPPMLNKENYVPWSSRLLRYAKSRPNGKLIYNSIMNGPYVRRMIPELEANDQAIQTILLGLPEDIYAAVDSCETAQEIWLRIQQMMKGSDIGIQEKKDKLFNEWERFTSTDGESIESYYHHFLKLMNDFKRNKYFPKRLNKVDDLRAERLAKTQDPLALVANSNNPFNYLVFSPGSCPSSKSDAVLAWINGEEEGIILDTAWAEGNANRNNGNQIRCYNCRGLGHLARNYIVRPKRRDFDLMAAAMDLDEIEEVNANYILMANLQQASKSGTQTDKAPVYDSDGSIEVHDYDYCYNNEIFNMFTQEEQYTELLEPIPKPHQVQQNNSNISSGVSGVEQEEEQ
ncbi:hypothetical protein Tco_0304592 [Tanacetum coccineum]